MSTGLIGYHPQRIADLQRAAHRAADHLVRTPQTHEPLAGAALSAVRLVRLHLEQDWLPALSRVSGSTAMTGFGSFGLAGLTGLAGWSGGWSGGLTGQVPGPPGGIPPSFGMSNADARAAADAAMAAGLPGAFVGRTQTYEVLETAPSTSVPNTGHDPDAGSGQHDVIITDHWYFEHNLIAPPAPYGATPGGLLGRAVTTIARLLEDEPDPVPLERGQLYEQLANDGREWGNVGWQKNAAYGRLTTVDGDTVEVQWPADSGRHDRPGFVPNPTNRKFGYERVVSMTPNSRSSKMPQHVSIRATMA